MSLRHRIAARYLKEAKDGWDPDKPLTVPEDADFFDPERPYCSPMDVSFSSVISWQGHWKIEEPCVHCGLPAELCFTTWEQKGTKLLKDKHENGGEGEYWFHDATAWAMYFCRHCFGVTAFVTQA